MCGVSVAPSGFYVAGGWSADGVRARKRLAPKLGEGDGGVFEVFAEKTLDEDPQVFPGFGEDEGLRGLGPVELEAGGLGGDPDLADRGVGGEDELSGAVLEQDIEDAVLLLGFESSGLFGDDEGLLERGEGAVGFTAEGGFVDQGHRGSSLRQAELGVILG